MLFLRNMIDNHKILTSILVIYFCLFLGLNQAVAIVWKIVGAALGIIAVIQLIRGAIKTLDEKIAAIEAEIIRLGKLEEEWRDEYEKKRAEMKQREREAKSARRAYNAAVTAYNEAVSAEEAAESAYRSAKRWADHAKKEYQKHVRWCSVCQGSALCPTGSELNETWQSAEREKREAKQAWDTAKAQVTSARSAKNAAYIAHLNAQRMLVKATIAANAALARLRAIKAEIKRLAAELEPLLEEKADNEELLREAMEQLNNAKQELDIAEQNHPHEWATAMMDPEFREAVEEIRSY